LERRNRPTARVAGKILFDFSGLCKTWGFPCRWLWRLLECDAVRFCRAICRFQKKKIMEN